MQTLKLMFFSSLFWGMISCNTGKKQKPADNKVDTTIVQKKKLIEVDSFIKNSIDTSRYVALPYYDTTIGDHRGSKGYIDTFTIHNYTFRIVHQDTMYDGVVEKNKNGQWLRVMQFDNLGNHNDYDVSWDLNGDGYRDLIFYWKWYGEIHFFDTTKNEFSDTANSSMGIEWDVLDSNNHIFYENQFGKLMHSPVSSNLFTFKNAKRIDIATLSMTFDPNSEDDICTEGDLYLQGNDKQIEKVIPDEKISVTSFDYQKFWQEHYKKFLNSR